MRVERSMGHLHQLAEVNVRSGLGLAGESVPRTDVWSPPRRKPLILVVARKRSKTSSKQGRPKRRPDALLLGRQPFDERKGKHGLGDPEIRPD